MIRPLALLFLVLAPAAIIAAGKAPSVDPRLKAEFAASDTDRNGVLSRAEVEARVGRMNAGKTRLAPDQAKSMADRLFALADGNRDGKLTPLEMQTLFRVMARRYDANHDGVVSVEERRAARAAVTAEANGGR